jgi:hypothetical protein
MCPCPAGVAALAATHAGRRRAARGEQHLAHVRRDACGRRDGTGERASHACAEGGVRVLSKYEFILVHVALRYDYWYKLISLSSVVS